MAKKATKKKLVKKTVAKKSTTKTKKIPQKKTTPKATPKAIDKQGKKKSTKDSEAKTSLRIKKDKPIQTSEPVLTDGSIFDLKKYLGQNVVLYFYPKDNTPGCTQEGLDFSALSDDFRKLNTVVFGISRDSQNSHIKFKEKMNYKVDLISDESSQMCDRFEVIKEKNMYGKKVMGIERSTFIFDSKGHLVKEWRKVKVDGHAQEVLSFVKTIKT